MSEFQKQFYEPHLAKDQKKYPRGIYDPFPTFPLNNEEIFQEFPALAKIIKERLKHGLRVLVIDGFQGVDWERFRTGLGNSLDELSLDVNWFSMAECQATKEE